MAMTEVPNDVRVMNQFPPHISAVLPEQAKLQLDESTALSAAELARPLPQKPVYQHHSYVSQCTKDAHTAKSTLWPSTCTQESGTAAHSQCWSSSPT